MSIEKKFENDAEYNHKRVIWVTLNDLLKSSIEKAGMIRYSSQSLLKYRVAGVKVAVEAMGMEEFFELSLKQMDDLLVIVFGIYMSAKYESWNNLESYLDDLMNFMNETRQVDF